MATCVTNASTGTGFRGCSKSVAIERWQQEHNEKRPKQAQGEPTPVGYANSYSDTGR